ncbi:MAG: site-specific DNA-methyltransferase [Opitutaceae bacterium]|jgi:adenine-specific DNA-methyltransferase|nr:site-specific DNA-methyltransferase [Opitutaceae bacterium]
MYVVQTVPKVIQRCLLMTTSPGDLVLDPTCGSGTTAYVAEQWGRRWITIDTSRVAIAIARQRLLTACFDTYKTRDPSAGADPNAPQNPAFGFYYKTVPHITLKSIAQNKALDAIFAKHEPILAEKLAALNAALGRAVSPKPPREGNGGNHGNGGLGETALPAKLVAKLLAKVAAEKWSSVTEADKRRWILPGTDGNLFQAAATAKTLSAKQVAELRAFAASREKEWQPWQAPFDSDPDWPAELRDALAAYRAAWRAKMDEVNAAIAANAEQEELVDQPEALRGVARVSGPFTVESMRPPETSLKGGAGDNEETPIDGAPDQLPETFEATETPERDSANAASHIERMLGWLRHDGVTFLGNKHAAFARLDAVDGCFLHGEGEIAADGGEPRRAAVVIGPEFGSVTSYQVENALRDAFRRGYDDLIFAGFSFDAQAQETIAAENERKGAKMRIHMAQIRPDVGMEDLLKKTNKVEQIFTVFGQPRTSVRQVAQGGDGSPSRPQNATDGGGGFGETALPEYIVRMEGVDLYNPVTNALDATGADRVAAWFVDTDYDGKVFCVCQAFFPDKTAWDKIARALKTGLEPGAFAALSGTESLPFKPGPRGRVAVKVIDPRGNEVMRVHSLDTDYSKGEEN